MNIIEVKGEEYVLGMVWQPLTGLESEKSELKQLGEQLGHSFGVVIENGDGEKRIGLTDKEGAGKFSAAGALCKNYKDIVVIEPRGKTRAWIVMISNGLILPGTDVEAHLEEVIDIYNENLSLLKFERGGHHIYASGLSEYFEEAHDVKLSKLLSKIEVDKKADVIRRVAGGISPLMMGVIALAFGMGGYLVYKKNQTPDYSQYVPKVSAPKIQPGPDKDELRSKASEEEVNRLRNTTLPRFEPYSLLSEIGGIVKSHPVSKGGWNAVQFIFQHTDGPAADGSLVVKWERIEGYGTVNSLRDSVAQQIAFDETGDTATTITMLSAKKSFKGDPLDVLIKERNSFVNFMDLLQRMDLQWAVVKSTPAQRYELIEGLDSPENAQWRHPYNARTFSVSGSEFWALSKFAEQVAVYKTFKIKTITVDTKEMTPSWKIEGELYER